MTVVNGVDSDRLHEAADRLRQPGAADVALPAKLAAEFLELVALQIEQSRLGDLIPGLHIVGQIAGLARREGEIGERHEQVDQRQST